MLQFFTVFFTMLIIFLFMGGTLLGFYLYLDRLIDDPYRDGPSLEELSTPVVISRSYGSERAPLFIVPWSPPENAPSEWDCKILVQSNVTTGAVDGFEGIGAVLNLTLENFGDLDLYIEWANITLGWGESINGRIGRYVNASETRHMKHFLLPSPTTYVPDESMTFQVDLDILIKDGMQWIRREDVSFGSIDIHLEPRYTPSYVTEIKYNPSYYFDKINNMIEKDEDRIASILKNTSFGNDPFSIQSIADVYEFVVSRLEYIPDPDTGKNQWISPVTCLSKGGGDCEDYSVLFGAMINGLGGSARVIVTSGHAFNAVFIGDHASSLEKLQGRYGMEIPFQILEDEMGKWLLVEPQSKLIFGWFPLDVQPVSTGTMDMEIYGHNGPGWGFVDSESVSIVDIYFN